jgi:hypothetical protein
MIGISHDLSLGPNTASAAKSRNNPAPRAKAKPMSLQPVKVEYLPGTAPELADYDDSEDDLPSTPIQVYNEKTPSSDFLEDAKQRMQEVVDIEEIPITARTTALKVCRCVRLKQEHQATQSQTSKQVYRANDSINQHRAQYGNQADEQAWPRAVAEGVGSASGRANHGLLVAEPRTRSHGGKAAGREDV